jgi:MoxR-like ATPase
MLLPGRRATASGYMVRLEDVQEVAPAVLTHRLITTFAAQAEGITARDIVKRLIEESNEDE